MISSFFCFCFFFLFFKHWKLPHIPGGVLCHNEVTINIWTEVVVCSFYVTGKPEEVQFHHSWRGWMWYIHTADLCVLFTLLWNLFSLIGFSHLVLGPHLLFVFYLHSACLLNIIIFYHIFIQGSLKGRDHSEYLGIDGKIILEWMLGK